MAHFHSPRIVTDGLVLALDAANKKSFRGEPTENLLDTDLRNWSKDNGSQVTLLTETFRGNSIYRVTFPAGTLPRIRINFLYTTGQTFTGHLFYRYVSGQDSGEQLPRFIFRESGFGTTHTSTSFPVTTEFTFRSITHTFSSNGTSMFLLYRSTSSTSTEVVMDFSMPQLEQKPYPTPFVDGTRGSTVATGGGWADRSGNGNHGELVNNPTFDSDNLGSLEFDGSENYIELLPVIPSTSNFTLSIWFFLNNVEGSGSNDQNSKVLLSQDGDNFTLYGATTWGSADMEIRLIVSTPEVLVGPDVRGIWSNVVLTRTVNLWSLYINGMNYISSSTERTVSQSGNMLIGRSSVAGRYFDGNIPQVHIYNRSLSSEEILQNYNATKGRYGL